MPVYCGVGRCFDDCPLDHPDSRIARSSASASVVLRTGVFGWTVLGALSPAASVRVTITGAAVVAAWFAGTIVAEGGVTLVRTGTASATGCVSSDGVRTAGVAGDAARATGISGPSGIGMNVDVDVDVDVDADTAACGAAMSPADVSGACDPVLTRVESEATGAACVDVATVAGMTGIGRNGADGTDTTLRAEDDDGDGDAGATASGVGTLDFGVARAVAGAVLFSHPERVIACSTSVCASTLLASIARTSRAF